MVKRLLSFCLFFSVITPAWALPKPPRRAIVTFKPGSDTQFAGRSVGKQQGTQRLIVELAPGEDLDNLKEQWEDVAHVEEDVWLTHFAMTTPTTNDPLANAQWHLFDDYTGIDLNGVLVESSGEAVVVAVVDTGIRPHRDFAGRILPGADLVSDSFVANDGDARDNDASDPGDWITAGDWCYQGTFKQSTWHGTHVAGTILAQNDNGTDISGINTHAKLLPVRVLGKCGGYSSDIADGIRWAAGGNVEGVAPNANPAKVINLSLGGGGVCGETMQSAINFAVSRGAVVVVASGNSGANLDFNSVTPASCDNVITVGASNKFRQLSWFSNYGRAVDIIAPGGESPSGVVSLSNNGSTTAGGDSVAQMSGTSMATPHIAGIVSLMKSVNPAIAAHQVKEILRQGGSAMSGTCSGGQRCGGGFIAAVDAVARAASTIAEDPIVGGQAPVTQWPGTPLLSSSQEEGGGACGTVDMSGGPGNFGGGMLIGLCFIFLLGKVPSVKRFA